MAVAQSSSSQRSEKKSGINNENKEITIFYFEELYSPLQPGPSFAGFKNARICDGTTETTRQQRVYEQNQANVPAPSNRNTW